MTYSLELSEFAVQDVSEIIEWYRDQKEGLEYEFISSLEITLSQVESNPLAFQPRSNIQELLCYSAFHTR